MGENKKYLNISITLFVGLIILLITFFFSFLSGEQKYIFSQKSPELRLSFLSPFGKTKGKVVAASCAYSDGRKDASGNFILPPNAGHVPEDYTACQVDCCYGPDVPGTRLCGGACLETVASAGSASGGGNAAIPICQNHPNFGQPCTSAQNLCGETTTGTYDRCGICSANAPGTTPCSITNACGQTFTGVLCGTTCTATNGNTDPNSSCIVDFTPSTDSVNPNGSVEFTWKLAEVPGVTSKCGFVDLTTPTPRLIPGLQDLDPSVDRARITNIQISTRFCLICQFYNLIDNSSLGDPAVIHQWIRVIRIGEN